MKNNIASIITLALFMVSFMIYGCDSNTEQGKSFEEAAPEDVTMVEDDHGHNHPSEGPHHGSLIELGKEAYHAELVHDEKSGSVTIYILDDAVKKSVPIKAESIIINAKHDGKGQQFTLAAAPESNDPKGQSSRFNTQDKAIGELLEEHDVEARLVLEIDGKSYSGDIPAHDHDHKHAH
jgi:hypothetical protein